MKIRKIFAGIALLAASAAAFAQTASFINTAVKKSEESKKPIVMLITGSDWCPPCIALENRVFSGKEWKEYAKNDIVFLVCDIFPDGSPVFLKDIMIDGKSVKAEASGFAKQESELVYFLRKIRFEGTPTMLVYKPKSKIWKKVEPSANAKYLIHTLKTEAAKQ